jgi:hypothetical protein
MLSRRTILSLAQFLELFELRFLSLLLQKHGFPATDDYWTEQVIQGGLQGAANDQLLGLLDEIIRTRGDLRNRVTPRYRYDERWEDLLHCLGLDGYRLEEQRLVAADPTIQGTLPIEDDLTQQLNLSGLNEAPEIIRLMNASGDDFRRVPPDYNGCLTNARVALQTLGTAIARVRRASQPRNFDEAIWGQVLAYLRVSGLITQEEEQGIAGVYGFVSPAAHRPVGFTEEELARLGRSLAASMCYFLVKRHNGGR